MNLDIALIPEPLRAQWQKDLAALDEKLDDDARALLGKVVEEDPSFAADWAKVLAGSRFVVQALTMLAMSCRNEGMWPRGSLG